MWTNHYTEPNNKYFDLLIFFLADFIVEQNAFIDPYKMAFFFTQFIL